jgi:hypothetical protein
MAFTDDHAIVYIIYSYSYIIHSSRLFQYFSTHIHAMTSLIIIHESKDYQCIGNNNYSSG